MKLGIQLHLAGLSLSNIVSILEIFDVDRARPTVHNWVHKADLQPASGRSPDHVAVDETAIQLNNQQYWLYAVRRTAPVCRTAQELALVWAVDPETNELLHAKLAPTRINVIALAFVTELREKHDVDDALFLADGATSQNAACSRHGIDFRDEQQGNRNSAERVFREVKRRTVSFSNCVSHAEADTADDWLQSFAFA